MNESAQGADKLRAAMRAVGVDPIPDLVADGKVHRFDSPSDKRGRRSGWYVLFGSGVSVLGSWRGDIERQTFAANGNGKLSRVDREKIESAKRQAEAERGKLQSDAAAKARKLYQRAREISDPSEHQYLIEKGIEPPQGVRILHSVLVIPLFDRAGEISSLQLISPDGTKRFLAGGKVQECYFAIDGDPSRICLGEGLATMASVAKATGARAVAAMTAGNLVRVAKVLREKHPKTNIVICADDDRFTPDNPGLSKANEAAHAIGAGLAVPEFPPDVCGTDLNDLMNACGPEAVRALIEKALPKSTIPVGFLLKKDILYGTRENRQGEIEEFPICTRLEVIALTRDESSENWGRHLRFKDADGRQHEWSMPTEMLAGDGAEYRARLWQQGLTIWPTKEAKYGLHEYVSQCQPAARARAVSRVGWHRGVFVLPDTTFGVQENCERTLYQSVVSADHAFKVRGEINDWRREVSARCCGNSRLTFAVSAAFAAALLHLTNDESGGFHLVGPSSLGKTTCLRVGGSVWGGSSEPTGYLRQWRATANGLEGIAAIHSDALLCLDEIGQVNAREAGEVAYLLANGQGKSRARHDGSARTPLTWRVLFLSSGELTLADKIKEEGRGRATAGQQVRILDMPAEAGKFGLFENLHGVTSGQEFADSLRGATRRNYGSAARAFLTEVTKQAERIGDLARRHRADFIAQRLPTGASEQVGRAAARFGLVAAAGELATALGITGWADGAADQAAEACFKGWLARRGHSGPAEIEAGIEQVRRFFALHGGSRFGSSKASDVDEHGRVVLNRAGFRKDRDYCVFPEIFRSEIAASYDWRALADALVTRGLLKRGKDGKAQCPVREPGIGKSIRMFRFLPAILGEEVSESED